MKRNVHLLLLEEGLDFIGWEMGGVSVGTGEGYTTTATPFSSFSFFFFLLIFLLLHRPLPCCRFLRQCLLVASPTISYLIFSKQAYIECLCVFLIYVVYISMNNIYKDTHTYGNNKV